MLCYPSHVAVLLVTLFASTAWADFATTQFTSMTYPGYSGGPGTYSCPAPPDSSYTPLPVNLYVPTLAAGETAPLLIFFPGTANDLTLGQLTTAHSDALVKRAAQLGFVAAAVAYRSFDFNFLYPDRMDAKSRCVWAQGAGSLVSQLCGNQGPLASTPTHVDCAKGIVVAGHSQGGIMALLAKNYDSRVVAAYTLGIGGIYDPGDQCASDLGCDFVTKLFPHLADPALVAAQTGVLDAYVMGSSATRVLASDRIRAESGDVDPYLHSSYVGGPVTVADVTTRLNGLVNLSCAPSSSPATCFRPEGNGSGWILVGGSQLAPCAPNTACTAVAPESHAGHCFFSFGDSVGCTNSSGLTEVYDPDPGYFAAGATADWSLDANLNWLLDNVSAPGKAPSCGCSSGPSGFSILALTAIAFLVAPVRKGLRQQR